MHSGKEARNLALTISTWRTAGRNRKHPTNIYALPLWERALPRDRARSGRNPGDAGSRYLRILYARPRLSISPLYSPSTDNDRQRHVP
ncbi:protein of unknown function [Pseudomonas sp. JV241A]|nr:protein of unknown function [Pseudomonas sp. JV241A]